MNKCNNYLCICVQNVVSLTGGVSVSMLTLDLFFDTSVVICVGIDVYVYFNGYFNPVLVRTIERVTERIWEAADRLLPVSEEPDQP